MIYEVLNNDASNAITGQALADYFGCNIREVTAQIEKERRAGYPIAAATGGGYFAATDPEELQIYCRRIGKRAGELFKTRRALLATANNLRREAAHE